MPASATSRRDWPWTLDFAHTCNRLLPIAATTLAKPKLHSRNGCFRRRKPDRRSTTSGRSSIRSATAARWNRALASSRRAPLHFLSIWCLFRVRTTHQGFAHAWNTGVMWEQGEYSVSFGSQMVVIILQCFWLSSRSATFYFNFGLTCQSKYA